MTAARFPLYRPDPRRNRRRFSKPRLLEKPAWRRSLAMAAFVMIAASVGVIAATTSMRPEPGAGPVKSAAVSTNADDGTYPLASTPVWPTPSEEGTGKASAETTRAKAPRKATKVASATRNTPAGTTGPNTPGTPGTPGAPGTPATETPTPTVPPAAKPPAGTPPPAVVSLPGNGNGRQLGIWKHLKEFLGRMF